MSSQWSDIDVGALLDRFLRGQSYASLESEFGRSFDAIDTKLRKMGMCYSSAERMYKPREGKPSRDGEPWNKRDQYLYDLWKRHGCRGGIEYIETILNRTNVGKFVTPNYGRKGFFDEQEFVPKSTRKGRTNGCQGDEKKEESSMGSARRPGKASVRPTKRKNKHTRS